MHSKIAENTLVRSGYFIAIRALHLLLPPTDYMQKEEAGARTGEMSGLRRCPTPDIWKVPRF
eukprot:692625-Amphidinium_carterae.1